MHSIKPYWGVIVQLHSFLTSTLDAGKWSHLRPGRFKPARVLAVPIALEALCASESIWTLWRRATSLSPTSNWIAILQMTTSSLMTLYRLSHSRLHSNLEFIQVYVFKWGTSHIIYREIIHCLEILISKFCCNQRLMSFLFCLRLS
jgi:hypothetical protein